jgi:hypothetical protein
MTISIKYQYITELEEKRQTLELKIKFFNSAEIEEWKENFLYGKRGLWRN